MNSPRVNNPRVNNFSPEKIEAAVFDMDGLLIDSERVVLALYQHTCHDFGLQDKQALHELFLSCIGTNAAENDRRMYAALQHKVDVKQFLATWENRYREFQLDNTIPVKAGVRSLLNTLDARQIPAVVATSTRTAEAIAKLDKCQLAHRFKTITGGDQVENSKPEPDIFLRAAQSVNVRPELCLAFEDSANGVRAAVAAGMQVFQVPDLTPPDETLLALGHRVVSSLDEVEKAVWG